MSYAATILEDTTAHGVRMTTAMLTFPRWLLAEWNTHRVFSRNSGSSRAKPTGDLIAIARDPDQRFSPASYNERVKGMGIGKEADKKASEAGAKAWAWAAEDAADAAQTFVDNKLDKSRANRLLEPFMWHTAIVSSTEWRNFFALRCPPGNEPDIDFPAQWEFQQIAILLREEMRNSEPRKLGPDEWHLPLADYNEVLDVVTRQFSNLETDAEIQRAVLNVAGRRIARVSYDKHMDTEPVAVSLDKASQLTTSGHWSPFEHIARPIKQSDIFDYPDKLHVSIAEVMAMLNSGDKGYDSIRELRTGNIWSGNLRGYLQYRKMFKGEEDHSMLLDYEVM